MADIAEQEKAERRRARRQQRILASAESRLNKITSSQSSLRDSLSPSPSSSNSVSSSREATPVTTANTIAEHFPEPNDPRRRKYEQVKTLPPSPSTPPARHRPAVQKIIEEDQAKVLNDNGFLGGKVPQFLLANMLRKTNPDKKSRSRNPTNKFWNLLHFVSMVWLGVLVVYEEWTEHGPDRVADIISNPATKGTVCTHYPVFWQFMALEIAIRFARSVYQPEYNGVNESRFLNIASDLPKPLQRPAFFLQKYGVMANAIFRDLCIVIFVIGFISLVMALFK